jgi:phytoene desaturase
MAKAIVIGAGIAGLATALRLKKKGFKVDVYDTNVHTGGKLDAKTIDGYRFDLGPSLFTMPHLVDELFELHDRNAADYFQYKRKDLLCNYFWDDGTFFPAYADSSKFVKTAAKTFDEPESHITKYIRSTEEKYALTADLFLESSLHKIKNYFSSATLKAILSMHKLHLNSTLNQVNESFFDHPKLVQLFNRYATYNGSSPYQTPGIMSMIPHLEMSKGTYLPKGGMHEISQSLTRLARELGIEFKLGQKVNAIQHHNKAVTGIETKSGFHPADLIVSNADVYNSFGKLLPKAKQPTKNLKQEPSSSAMIFYWSMEKEFPELDLHNILFSNDYQAEFDHLFNKKTLFNDLTVYINITSKEEKSDAPDGCENWFVMINAPADYGQDWDQLKKQAYKNIVKKINKALATNIESYIQEKFFWDPTGIAKATGSYRGSLYGSSSNDKMAAFLRHPNFSKQFNNLYFCGGSVHPGGGIPLCLLSAKIVDDLIDNTK